MKKSIYIFSSGEIHRKQNTIYFEGERGKKYLPVENVSDIYIFGEVTINKKLLEYLCQMEVILHFFNHHGYFIGTFYPRQHYNSGHMILKQAEFYLDKEKRLDLARRFTSGAVENIKKVIRYYMNRKISLSSIWDNVENLEKSLKNQNSTEKIMAIEGNIREQYYKAFDQILTNPNFRLEQRSRRPPVNRLNALISFGNGLLYVAVLSEIYKTHLDPRIGFLHTTNFRRFTLNLDIAEIFKPIIVDRIIFTLVNKGMIQPKHFYEEANGIFLKENGRRTFIQELENRLLSTIEHRQLKRKVSYRRLIRLELYKLEKHLLGEKPYTPFVSRW